MEITEGYLVSFKMLIEQGRCPICGELIQLMGDRDCENGELYIACSYKHCKYYATVVIVSVYVK